MLERHTLKYFSPAWFAVIMGTGGLANILFSSPRDSFPFNHVLGLTIAGFVDLLYFIVLIPWLLRWLFYFDYVRCDLHHPVSTNFFVTMPVGTAIVGTNIYFIWIQYLGELLTFHLIGLTWLFAVFGVTFFSFFTTFQMIRIKESPGPELITFSWIMAPIANMAVLLIGNPVLSMALKFEPSWALSILVVNSALFGIGFFLFLFISAIVFVRLAHHPLPPAELTPSFGIFLGAIGLAAGALLDTAKNAQNLGILPAVGPVNLGALIVWGFGIWIIGIIILISIYQTKHHGIPFSLGWWAYIFPLAAYTISTQKIASAFPSILTRGFSVFLTFFLVLLWLYTLWHTVSGVRSGKLFMGTPIRPVRRQ